MSKPKVHIVSRRLPPRACPSCGKLLDACTAAANRRELTIPTTGVKTCCCYCRAMLVMEESAFRAMTEAEWLSIDLANRRLYAQLLGGTPRILVPVEVTR